MKNAQEATPRLTDKSEGCRCERCNPEVGTATERLENALDEYRGAVYAEAQDAAVASVAQFVEDQEDHFRAADKGEWSCYGLAGQIREEFDLEEQLDRWPWHRLSSPPGSGEYLIWSRGTIVPRKYDAPAAREQRGDPSLAHVKNTWTFGWENLPEDTTHWRPLPEGPE